MKKIIDFIKNLKIFKPIKQYFYKKKMAKQIKYWRENPGVFCEQMLGIKLFDYQKEMLKKMNENKNIYYWRRR